MKIDENDNIYLGGRFIDSDGGSFLYTKYDTDGNQIYRSTTNYDSNLSWHETYDLDFSNEGNVFCVGYSSEIHDTPQPGWNQSRNGWIGKLDSDGNLTWTQNIKLDKNPLITGVCTAHDDGVVIIGWEFYAEAFHVFIKKVPEDGLTATRIPLTQAFNVLVSPNPTNALINIKLEGDIDERVEVRLFNQMGQIVKQASILNQQKNLGLDISNLIAGMYYLQVKGSTYQYTQGVVKE